MSFLKTLFGGNSGDGIKIIAELDHGDFHIAVTPQPEGSQFRLAAVISREIDGERKRYSLIRADLFTSSDECAKATVRKAKQVIKEQGNQLFS